MTYSLTNKCAKNYYNRALIVQVIAENVVTCFFLRHSVVSRVRLNNRVLLVRVQSISVSNSQLYEIYEVLSVSGPNA